MEKMKKVENNSLSWELFKKALRANKLNIRKFALKAGISQSTVYNWENVKNVKDDESIEAIERILKVKYSDLCVGKDESLTNVKPIEPVSDNGIHDHKIEWPVVGTSAAGPQLSAIPVSEYPGVADDWERLPEGIKCPDPNGFALVIVGDSMTPKLPDGAIVFVAPGIQPQNGEVALVIIEGRAGGRESCVKVIYDEGDKLRLHSYNEDKYPDKRIPKKYILNTYKVIAAKYQVTLEF